MVWDWPIIAVPPRGGLGYAESLCTWIAAALAAFGVLLVLWAWRPNHWRRHHSFRCPRCRYDLRGTLERSGYPLRCSECALDVVSEEGLIPARRARRVLGAALLVFVAAHVAAMWPQVRQHGWIRLVPATALVLQPMDVMAWTGAHLHRSTSGLTRPQAELGRRLHYGELWEWQERLLLLRVERSCRNDGREASTTGVHVYSVSSLAADPDDTANLVDILEAVVEPETWVHNGGTAAGSLIISGRVVIGATATVHLEIRRVLDDLRDAVSVQLPPAPPCQPLENPRAFTIESEFPTGMLDHVRAARSISIEALRRAGPDLDDGVTEEEPNACRPRALGMLDDLRDPASPRWRAAERTDPER